MLPEIATRLEISVEGRPYPVIAAGEGPLVVCLHGFPDNYESFQNQIEPFVSAGYRVVCPTLPGYIPGTEPVSGTNTPIYAADTIIALIEVLLKESGEEQCHLVRHDWGALTADVIANKRPDLLLSLAALSIPYNVNLQRVIFRCPRYIINAWYVTFFQLKSALSYYRNCIFGLNPTSFRWRRLYNGRIDVPTLGIRGEVDWCLPEVFWELTSPKSFRNGLTLEVMPGIGHFPHVEDPEWMSERLIRWFKQNSN